MNFRSDILPLKNLLFRTALRITMQREEAEDIVQDVMIKLWNNRDNLANVSNLEAYAVTSCRNLALDHLRKNTAITVSLDDIDSSVHISGGQQMKKVQEPVSENPYRDIYAKDELKLILDLMEQLPEKQRTCMHLRDFECKSYKEISEIMDISEDQVKINIFRARNFIKKSCTSV